MLKFPPAVDANVVIINQENDIKSDVRPAKQSTNRPQRKSRFPQREDFIPWTAFNFDNIGKRIRIDSCGQNAGQCEYRFCSNPQEIRTTEGGKKRRTPKRKTNTIKQKNATEPKNPSRLKKKIQPNVPSNNKSTQSDTQQSAASVNAKKSVHYKIMSALSKQMTSKSGKYGTTRSFAVDIPMSEDVYRDLFVKPMNLPLQYDKTYKIKVRDITKILGPNWHIHKSAKSSTLIRVVGLITVKYRNKFVVPAACKVCVRTSDGKPITCKHGVPRESGGRWVRLGFDFVRENPAHKKKPSL